MKLFDEKGKLFGKINIVDLLVVVLILAVILVVGTKVLGGQEGGDSPSASDPAVTTEAVLTYTVRVTAQREDVAEQLAQFVNPAEGKKDQIVHGGVPVANAYVVDYWVEPCRYNVITSGEIEIIGATEADAAGLVDICLVVEAAVEDVTTNTVGLLEVRLGKNHILKTAHMEFATGFVTACKWDMEG